MILDSPNSTLPLPSETRNFSSTNNQLGISNSQNTSSTGLAMGPDEIGRQQNYANELFKTHNLFETQQFTNKNNTFGISNSIDKPKTKNNNFSQATKNIKGNINQRNLNSLFAPKNEKPKIESKSTQPEVSQRSQAESMSQVEPRSQTESMPEIEPKKMTWDNWLRGFNNDKSDNTNTQNGKIDSSQNVYKNTAIAVSAKDSYKPDQVKSQQDPIQIQSPQMTPSNKSQSSSSSGSSSGKSSTLDMIAMARVAYPLWMQQGLNG